MGKNKWTGLLYISPWIVGFIIFTVYPFLNSLYISFTDFTMIQAPRIIGLDNYKELFQDKEFLNSLVATFKYALLTVPASLVFALLIAVILNFKIKGINFFRTAYYIPSILGGNVAISVIWKFLFTGDGLINQTLGFFGINSLPWMSDPNLAMIVVSSLRVWQFGSSMIIFLAALQNIPVELYEASEIDGAKKITQFFKITLPLITPSLFFNLVMGMVGAFQEFNSAYLITGGGPLKATQFTSLMIYNYSFKFFRMGYASAMSWILFVVIMIFTGIIFLSQKKWVYYVDEE
ncbi:carbohydrate ABC transporter permease [Enterococcus timonensis]|uniref:carbohydrate ABC transporter permease n=1 Tax=Enterococcus timonensis TaxID=1852364 RepID=UPI0008DB1AE7|nr:sugar ABC transporter permease [Enterococcus timonensis]